MLQNDHHCPHHSLSPRVLKLAFTSCAETLPADFARTAVLGIGVAIAFCVAQAAAVAGFRARPRLHATRYFSCSASLLAQFFTTKQARCCKRYAPEPKKEAVTMTERARTFTQKPGDALRRALRAAISPRRRLPLFRFALRRAQLLTSADNVFHRISRDHRRQRHTPRELLHGLG